MILLILSKAIISFIGFKPSEAMQKKFTEKVISESEADRIRIRGRKEIKYFSKVYLHVTAAAKMLSHAHFGIPKEVMGLLQGSYHEEKGKGAFVVSDVIFLPVEASETRVTADQETNILIATYSEWIRKIDTHQVVGWYHSHPSYGCWLSGIDVKTQEIFQISTDPFLAIVVDPIKSTSLQQLDIAAFRVHPNNYRDEGLVNVKDVPRRKAVDFGYHYQRYYQVPIEIVTNENGWETLKKVEKMEWASELASSSFFRQGDYLTEEATDEKADIEEYLEVKESPASKVIQVKEKEKSTMKKVAYYTKERNVSLIDSAVKSLLF